MNIIKKIKLRLRYKMLKNSFENKRMLCKNAYKICNYDCENCAWRATDEEVKAFIWYVQGKKYSKLEE